MPPRRQTHISKENSQLNRCQEECPNQRVHLDLYGPILDKVNAKKFIKVKTDAFSKFRRLAVLPNKEENTVANTFIKEWCHFVGFPRVTVTDQGREFTNSVLKATLTEAKIHHHTTSPYHPAANGQAEVFNRTMTRYLRATLTEECLDTAEWEGLLSAFQFSYNTSLHSVIKLPHSPSFSDTTQGSQALKRTKPKS